MSAPTVSKQSSRDVSRDGFGNRLSAFALTNFSFFWSFIQSIEPARRWFNQKLVNGAIAKTPPRPFTHSTIAEEDETKPGEYRLSTMGEYTSWYSLRDRTWSARHLPPVSVNGITLPDIAEVVDLFRRPEGQMKEDPKSTVLFAHFAQWFTDGFLRTHYKNEFKNTSNHDIDLTPLYGRTEEVTTMIRSHQGGKLKSQRLGPNDEEYPLFFYADEHGATAKAFRQYENTPAFEEFRPQFPEDKLPSELVLTLKPKLFAWGGDRANNQIGYVMLNTLFLREHNRICDVLAKAHPTWDDERLFQTTRNILIVILIKIVIEEYINHIAPYHFRFAVDAPISGGAAWYRENHMSVEFNLLYRWHPLVPDAYDIGQGEFVPLFNALFNNQLVIDRGLGQLFDAASRQPAGEIGLFNTASVLHNPLRIPERSLMHGRAARLASYNEYRARFDFPKVTSFDQITSCQRRRDALKELYNGRVNCVEFFVGLFAEDVRPNAVVGALVGRMVGVDAFSQALTNPLLNKNIYHSKTFSNAGIEIIESTKTISDVLKRNIPSSDDTYVASLTRLDWERAR